MAISARSTLPQPAARPAVTRPLHTVLPSAALALLLPAALFLPQAAFGQQSVRVPEGCDWTPRWPEGDLSSVSPYRSKFYFDTNHEHCGVIDIVLTDDDGVESPLHGGAGGPLLAGVFERTGVVARFPLESGKTYAIHFTWVDHRYPDDPVDHHPARPYTFTTAEVDEAPPADFDDLTIERFELIPGEDRVVFEAHWPNPSPLQAFDFTFSGLQDGDLPNVFPIWFPAQDAPDIRYEFTDVPFRRLRQSCVSLRLFEDSVLAGWPSNLTEECTDRGCSSIAAAPSFAWLAGLALVLFGRRRGGDR